MKEENESEYVKRTQRDYSYTFKLSVVREVESGHLGLRRPSTSMVFKVMPQ